jgi:hypothetical protein
MSRSLGNRFKVIGPALLFGAFLSAVAAVIVAMKVHLKFEQMIEIGLSILAGPFSGLWATSTWTMEKAIVWSAVCVLISVAHPIRAGWITGTASLFGIGLWFLLGFGLTFDGV